VLPQIGFLSHNFGSRYARKPIKDSKDSDHSLIFNKKIKPKNGWLGWRPESGKLGQKGENMPYYDGTHKKNKPKTKFFKF